MGPDRNKHLRNIAIILVLAVAVWQLPGGGTAADTISNLFSIIFLGGLLFLGYRLYVQNRETIYGLEERMRALLYGCTRADRDHARRDRADVGRRRARRGALARVHRRRRVRARHGVALVPDVLSQSS